MNVTGVAGNVRSPHTEAAVPVDGSHPLRKELALRLLFLIVLPLHFQDQHFAVCQSNKIVRSKLADDAPKRICDLKSKVIVLHPRGHMRAAIKVKSFARFPAAIESAHVDVRVLRTGAATELGSKASDMDLLLVLPEYDQLEAVADRLSNVPGLDDASLDLFRRRIAIFLKVRSEHSPCIFSHKLVFWNERTDSVLSGSGIPGEYKLSFHVFSLADFDYLTLKDIPILRPPNGSDIFDRALRDYRDSAPPDDKAYDSRSFAGIPLGTHPLSPTEIDLGFLSNVQVCLIKEDRYCPGLHQNLILPQFENRWESESVRLYLRMLTFRWKILERLRTEKTNRPFEEQSLSLSHVRYFVFSPHITRRADRG